MSDQKETKKYGGFWDRSLSKRELLVLLRNASIVATVAQGLPWRAALAHIIETESPDAPDVVTEASTAAAPAPETDPTTIKVSVIEEEQNPFLPDSAAASENRQVPNTIEYLTEDPVGFDVEDVPGEEVQYFAVEFEGRRYYGYYRVRNWIETGEYQNVFDNNRQVALFYLRPYIEIDGEEERVRFEAATQLLEVCLQDSTDAQQLVDADGTAYTIERKARRVHLYCATEVTSGKTRDLLGEFYRDLENDSEEEYQTEPIIIHYGATKGELNIQRVRVQPNIPRVINSLADTMFSMEASVRAAGHPPEGVDEPVAVVQIISCGLNSAGAYASGNKIIIKPDGQHIPTLPYAVAANMSPLASTDRIRTHEKAHATDDNRTAIPSNGTTTFPPLGYSLLTEGVADLSSYTFGTLISDTFSAANMFGLNAATLLSKHQIGNYDNGYFHSVFLWYWVNKLQLPVNSLDLMIRYQQLRTELFLSDNSAVDAKDSLYVFQKLAGIEQPTLNVEQGFIEFLLDILSGKVHDVPITVMSNYKQYFELYLGALKRNHSTHERLLYKIPERMYPYVPISWCWYSVAPMHLKRMIIRSYDSVATRQRVTTEEEARQSESIRYEVQASATAQTAFPGIKIYIPAANEQGYVEVLVDSAETDVTELVKQAGRELGLAAVSILVVNHNAVIVTDDVTSKAQPIILQFDSAYDEIHLPIVANNEVFNSSQ